MCSVSEDVLMKDRSLRNFRDATGSFSIQDVATLVETFELVLTEIASSSEIARVVQDSQGYYLFVTSSSSDGSFDFYDFLNKHYSGNVEITCVNAKRIFPRGLSRGIYPNIQDEQEGISQEDGSDEKTGFMDEDELKGITQGVKFNVYHSKVNRLIPLPCAGLIIGRSGKQSDYVVSGNTNVSRKHCRIYQEGLLVKVHDFDTPNGTYINGCRVHSEDEILNVGDVLLLADEEFTLK